VLAAPEGADHPEPDRALLGEGGEVALLVLHPARDHDVLALEPLGQRDDRHRGDGDDEAERPVHVQQHERDHDELDDVDDQEQHPEPEEPPDAAQVGGHPRQQLARLPLPVERHRQLLQPLVEVVPHDGLDVQDGVGLHPAPPEDERGLDDAQRERQQAEREDRPDLLVGDRPVDQRLRDQGDRDRETDARERGREHDRQRPEVRAEVAAQAPQ
jgi:hypothetical protein